MKTRFSIIHRFVALSQILLIASPLMFYSPYAQAGCAACDQYNAAKAKCARPSPSPSPSSQTVTAPTDACSSTAFQMQWGQVAQHCDSIKSAESAKDGDMITAAVYTAAAAVCLSSCFYEKMPWSYAAARMACLISGGVAGVTDLTQSIILGDTGGAVVGGVAAAAAVASGITMSTAQAMFSANESCWAAGLLAAIAGYKWYAMSSASAKADEACSNAASFGGTGGANNLGGFVGAPGLAANGGLTAGGGASSGAVSKPVLSTLDGPGFPSGVLSAATAGPDVFGKFPNAGKFPEALQDMGFTPGDIANSLQSRSPSAILSTLPGLPDGVVKALNDIDQAAHDGKIQLQGGGGGSFTAGSGGGGSKAGGGSDPFSGFGDLLGKKDGAKLGDPTLLGNFRKSAGTESDDIWHTGFKGSIFQIVSGRIEKSRDKIQPGEWASPLNRALMGLPAAKPDSKGLK